MDLHSLLDYGFVDLQVNGGPRIATAGGPIIGFADFTSRDLELEHIEQVTRWLWERGTIAYLATIISADRDIYTP